MVENFEQEIDELRLKPRNPFLAFLLSLIVPGLGQVYNGELRKGVLGFVSLFVTVIVIGLLGLQKSFYGILTLICLELSIRIYLIVDAIIISKRLKHYKHKVYNTWYYHLLYTTMVYVVFFTLDTPNFLGINTFMISNTSQEPTLIAGDRVISDIHAYKNTSIDYGDIVTFHPKAIEAFGNDTSQIWTFRIVGLPNDEIIIDDNKLYINGKQCSYSYKKHTSYLNLPTTEYIETLPNGHKHLINVFKHNDEYLKRTDTLQLNNHEYYVLGDSRDNAYDSRFLGAIKQSKITGRVIYTYWSNKLNRINIDLRNK